MSPQKSFGCDRRIYVEYVPVRICRPFHNLSFKIEGSKISHNDDDGDDDDDNDLNSDDTDDNDDNDDDNYDDNDSDDDCNGDDDLHKVKCIYIDIKNSPV